LKNWSQNRWAFLVLIVIAAIIAPVIYFSRGSFQLGDTYAHYYIARWALRYPEMLVSHWGKPVFTSLYAIPSQLGYTAAKFFTLLIGLTACWFTFKTSKELKHSFALPSIFFLLSSPIYFIHLNSTMTETLFSLVTIVCVYLLLKEKYLWSALLFSFLPFVRTEGFILLPLFSLWFLYKKQWKGFLLLAAGTIFYSLLGWFFHYHNFFWVFTANPYAWESTYGSGELWHFVTSNKIIWGIPFAIVLCLGMAVHVFYWGKMKRKKLDLNRELFLALIPALIFLAFHSIAWWQGRMASAGEVRVIISVMPLFALVANRGLTEVLAIIPRIGMLKPILIAAACIYLFAIPFFMFDLPLKRARDHELVYRSCQFIRQNISGKKIWFIDPLVPVELDLDGFGNKEAQQWFPHPATPQVDVVPGEIVFWDGHFCPKEGKTKLTSFTETPYFKTLAHFVPEIPFTVFGNPYEIFIFERTDMPNLNTLNQK